MRYYFILFVVLVFAQGNLTAQQVYFSKSHTNDGKPIDAQIEWGIKPWGEKLFIILDNEGKELNGNFIYLFIDREIEGVFEPIDSKAIRIERNSTWVAHQFNFIEVGRYKAYFINDSQDTLAQESLTLKLEDEYTESRKSYSNLYYDGLKLVFCERVIAGRIINEKKNISISKDEGKVHVYLIGNSPLNTEKLFVDVWRKSESSFDYDEFIESKKYRMDPTWPDAFFRYQFAGPGNYKISIYNDDEVLIRSGFITVYN